MSYAYDSHSGTVDGGTTTVIYVPLNTSVALNTHQSFYIFRFEGWSGAITNSSGITSINVTTPYDVKAVFSLDFVNIGITIASVTAPVLGIMLMVYRKRKRLSI